MSTITSTDTETETEPGARDLAPPAPTLTIVHHPDPRFLGERAVLASAHVEIGRESQIFGRDALAHARISRRHAKIAVEHGSLLVEDLGSHNGTYINGARVAHGAAAPGDVIEIGPVLLLYHVALSAYALPKSARIVGKSAAIARVLAAVAAVAKHPTTTLVRGETGTGKELVAREIHDSSGRRGPFVAFNCGSVSKGLLHSELFGHERGAFSGATGARRGHFEAANEGTLLLDEIGDAPPDLQIALLRVLQEREVLPLGASRPVPTTARVVAATHQNLEELVAAGRFREDLFARLSPWVIEVPPLRARPEDIPHIAARILARLHEPRPLHRSATLALVRAEYPRNVRQLEAAIERMVREAKPEDSELRLSEGALELLSPVPSPARRPDEPKRTSPSAAPSPTAAPRADATRDIARDKESLTRLLEAHGGNVTRAAAHLGIGRNTLYRWLREASVILDDVRG